MNIVILIPGFPGIKITMFIMVFMVFIMVFMVIMVVWFLPKKPGSGESPIAPDKWEYAGKVSTFTNMFIRYVFFLLSFLR